MTTNSYFDHPASGSRYVNFNVLTGDELNESLDLVTAGFDKLPTPAKVNGNYAHYAAATGSANTYAVTLSTQIVALADGLGVRFKANLANSGAATLNVNSLGAKSIVRPSGAALEASDIATGQIVEVWYDSTNDRFQLSALVSGSAAPASLFSGTAGGVVDLLAGASVASAATVNLNGTTGNLVHITGVVTITAVTLTRGPRWVVFDGALTLTHHATNNNLPGAANITTAAGDRAMYYSDGTAVYCLAYVRADGTPVSINAASQAEVEAASSTVKTLTPGNVKWNPGVAKAWLYCDSAGTIVASHNITSITDTGTGYVTVTIATDFSSGNYTAVACGMTQGVTVHVVNLAAGTLEMHAYTYTGASYQTQDTSYMLACFGDQ